MMTSYNIGQGRFKASVREYPGQTEISADPEHDVCHGLTLAGCPDGPVQFWRGGVRTLSHSSMQEMGKRRIGLGGDYPYRRGKRSKFSGLPEHQDAGGFGGEP